MSGSLETVALAGNPNAGKTTIFNALTGSNQQVGNYAGVTVERKSGEFFTPHGKKLRLVDLPGCYSLDGGSPDQQIARKVLLGELEGEERPDLVVSVVDGSALERHLQLTLEVIETGLPVVVALNMVDVAESTGIRIDVQKLSEELGVPVVPMQANAGKGLLDLKQAMRHPFPVPAKADWTPEERQKRVLRICETAARRRDSYSATLTDRVDAVLLHPIFGWGFFLAIMFCLFWTIFAIADIPIGWIEGGTEVVAEWVSAKMPEGDLRSLIVDGVVNGIGGGVLVFLPQIVMLFFLIGLLESSGYMARAAYLMDGIMAKFRLSGRSFLPVLSSFACAIPGVMATRTIDSPKERLATIFVAPWMSCSARIPVYLTLVPLLFTDMTSVQKTLIFIGIYLTGLITALIVARLLRGRMGEDKVPNHFLLELPPYRAPQWGYIFRHVLGRAGAFLKNAGTIILAICIILWALSTYPKTDSEDPAEVLAHSAMGRISHVVEPLVKPLGFDGRTGTAILTSFAAREVFVTSMTQLFHVEESEDEDETLTNLQNTLSAATWPNGDKMFTLPALLALLVFYIYALQCLPTSAVVAREAGSWKWAAGQFLFMSGFAWVAAFIVFQVTKLFL
ncbi:ferrous iron transporter B [Luteolibacter flavescens]|uniref:Ferrous iron transporter B n=1 Tax=Luteolibacter flavescens TaxID=1859460 RepID=A0ABT3FSP9_9BACT|nr:ferrous iron transporter B [Luteolibacter flavescens]MCW1886577.1 ferrous iron transporter B [Luteolibacter flavescens]